MNTLVKRLPVFAFVLAAFAAFAFAPAHTNEYAFDGEEWINVSTMDPEEDYLCIESTEVCTRSAPNELAPKVKDGLFVLTEQ